MAHPHPSNATIPAPIPDSPLSDRNLVERSIIERISATSLRPLSISVIGSSVKVLCGTKLMNKKYNVKQNQYSGIHRVLPLYSPPCQRCRHTRSTEHREHQERRPNALEKQSLCRRHDPHRTHEEGEEQHHHAEAEHLSRETHCSQRR